MKNLRILFLLYFFTLTSTTSDGQTMQAFMKAGEQAMNEKDFFSAQTYFQRVLTFEPSQLPANFLLAEAYMQTNDLSNASVFYKRTIELDDHHIYIEAVFQLALIEMKRENYKAALDQLVAYKSSSGDQNREELDRAIANCNFAIEAIKHPISIKVVNIGDKINSPYSDFSAHIASKDELYFSSLQFLGKFNDVKTDSKISKILVAKRREDLWSSAMELPASINRPDSHNCNSMITSDGQILVFTRCNYNDEGILKCDIYECQIGRNGWLSPTRLSSNINKKGSTNTHPFLAIDKSGEYVLYFVSDREDGFGETDIWFSKRAPNGTYGDPVNCGNKINTAGREVSPAFYADSKTLFFSTDHMTGFGGFDVYNAKYNKNEFDSIENFGYPVNSGFDDLYFRLDPTGNKVTFSSNREESMFITASSCCYDIYFGAYFEPEAIIPDTTNLSVSEVINRLNDYLPLKLYFHNDEPNPKTLDTITEITYYSTYIEYLNKIDLYKSEYSLSGDDPVLAINLVDSFFTNHVKTGYAHLDKFLTILGDQVDSGKKIKLKIRGHCSPLAASFYNVNLAKRRISSLLNYMSTFENNRFEEAVKNGRLILEEIPAGESLAASGVSDDLKDKKNSIYSPAAAQERRIEISAVEID